MERRARIPLALLALLAVLTVVFAVVALAMAPSSASLTVQNGTSATYGSPAGSQSLSLSLRDVTPGASASITLRFLNFAPPATMSIFQTQPTARRFGVLHADAVRGLVDSFAAMTGGSGAWTAHGSTFTRTESLTAFHQRINEPGVSSDRVLETAIVRGGYLVAFRYRIVSAGQTQHVLTVHILRVNGAKTPAVSS